MTEIVASEYVTNELSKRAMGGTEQMAQRMVRDLDPELLKHFQIIHSRPRELRPDLKKILVCHDLSNDPEVASLGDESYRKQFDKIVFVSNWQAQMYNIQHGIPYSDFVVIPNAIEPFEVAPRPPKAPDEPIRLIYHTTPHRGLALLCAAMDALTATDRFAHLNVELDVYSSFGVYGWEERDTQYHKLFEHLKSLPGVRYHGAVSNQEVRAALTRSDIFAYPCIWPETSCIAAIEAACAGNHILHPNLAALPETIKFMDPATEYQWHEDPNKHAKIFFDHLVQLISAIRHDPEGSSAVVYRQALAYNHTYNWHSRAKVWDNLLRSLL